jgi:hypothetical protein
MKGDIIARAAVIFLLTASSCSDGYRLYVKEETGYNEAFTRFSGWKGGDIVEPVAL